jgi:hypothetical protein
MSLAFAPPYNLFGEKSHLKQLFAFSWLLMLFFIQKLKWDLEHHTKHPLSIFSIGLQGISILMKFYLKHMSQILRCNFNKNLKFKNVTPMKDFFQSSQVEPT